MWLLYAQPSLSPHFVKSRLKGNPSSIWCHVQKTGAIIIEDSRIPGGHVKKIFVLIKEWLIFGGQALMGKTGSPRKQATKGEQLIWPDVLHTYM